MKRRGPEASAPAGAADAAPLTIAGVPVTLAQVQARVAELLAAGEPGLHPGELGPLVAACLERAPLYLDAARRFGTPQYLLEEDVLQRRAERFCAAFATGVRPVHVHYAFKSNPTQPVVEALARAGLAADCSSGLELELALACGFERIVLSGPAKTDEELDLALQHGHRVTVHLDSFGELERLERLAAGAGSRVRAGIRVNTRAHGLWTKFGIPLDALPELVRRAASAGHVQLAGVQFHLSWQRSAAGYADTLAEVGQCLAACAPAGGWHFVDIGGGYYPEDDEGVYPWMTARGRLLALLGLAPADGPPAGWDGAYLLHTVAPIEAMAARILEACRTHLAPVEPVELWLEPGRYLANQAVHLLLRVADVKSDQVVITDGGTNLLGWERLESEHCPLINLTHPAPVQRRCRVYGSLCTPHDLWGYTCYASEVAVGDVLLLPAQGSYVQTLAQRFIKPVCQTVVSDGAGGLRQALAAERFGDRYPALASTGGR
ncbi:MAG: alanine racemase [Gemmatimonadota bacterium]